MTLDFDLAKVVATEFGVGRDTGNGLAYSRVPVGVDVQGALLEMVKDTWAALQQVEDGPATYQPAEKYGATEHLVLPASDSLGDSLRLLHDAANLNIDSTALSHADDVYCYFVRLTDEEGRHLTGIRRATQFKGIIKSRNRLVRMVDDTLTIIHDAVFKLDRDFDLLIDSENIHILRPSGFEFTGKLGEAILGAVAANMKELREELPFVRFDEIEAYASRHPRAARYVASIRSQREAKSVDKRLLKSHCKQSKVEIREHAGILHVAEGHELGFLEVLDRRRYGMTLVKETPELYRAASRTKLDG